MTAYQPWESTSYRIADDGGWGLNGNADTNAELVDGARAELAQLAGND
jgi:hypothetical protein